MQINDIIALEKDQYQLIEKQVGGAQAYVFKVRRVSDQQILALKVARIWKKPDVLWPVSRVNANCTRIQQEIDFLQALDEPEKHYIVACLDSATLQQGGKDVPAFVMPFYEQPLSKALLDDEQPTLARHLTWIQQMIMALKYIHHHRKDGEALLHRDFKLDNLMLTDKDEIRLLDFGISKQVLRSTDSTHTKMNYSDDCVAPEQILLIKPNTDGKKHVAIGTHTDIYALGLLMYRLIAGHLPESHEQFIMNLEELSQQHREALNNGEEGLLGKIGGITEEETEFLVQSFVDLAEGIPVTFTYDDEFDDEDASTDSPYQTLAERFAEFVAELLDKRYQDRPNAKSALYWVENVQFKLSALDKKVAKEKERKEKEKGAEKKAEEEKKKEAERNKRTVAPSIPTKPPTRRTENVIDETVVMPTPSRQPVPRQPPPPKKPVRTSVLSGFEPDNKSKGTKGNKGNEGEKDIPIIPANWPVKKILIGLVVISLAINGWLFLRPKTDSTLPDDDTNTPSYQPSESETNNQNNKVIPNENALGNDRNKWAAVIPKLKRLAQQGNAEAAALLAGAYQNGKGGETDWGKAWRYYQQALKQGSDSKLEQQQQALELKANSILTDTSSPTAQRQRAYQVIETVAAQDLIPLSINARLWMEYRYRTGDGVAVNHSRADEWNRKYNAIKDKMQ